MGKTSKFRILKSGVYWFERKIDITHYYDENCLVVDSGKSCGFFSVPVNEVTEIPVKRRMKSITD